ncbi:LysR family transcriptional regulator [Termitidicoccus mucosus]|uniref:LysR family transcriptional regulator n=1 Tax=Termitidicoccus mucosus TaxID=1184151 RepID=UPI000839792C
MNTDHLRAFSLIVELGSLNRAAQQLRVSQSTLTRQMQALEQELGGRLLERTPGGVAPTAAGHALLDGARPVLERLDAVLQNVRGLVRGKSTTLAVGYLGSAGDFINPALAALRASHPEVKVKLHDLSPGEQITALRRAEIDFALIGQAGAFLSHEFHTRKLAALPVVVALSATHPLARQDTLAMADLRRELFVGASDRDMPGYDRWVARLCRGAKFAPKFLDGADSLAQSMSLLLTEEAVALHPAYLADARFPGVVFRPLRDKNAQWDMYVAWQRGRAPAPLLAFLDSLTQSVAECAIRNGDAPAIGWTKHPFDEIPPLSESSHLAKRPPLKATPSK